MGHMVVWEPALGHGSSSQRPRMKPSPSAKANLLPPRTAPTIIVDAEAGAIIAALQTSAQVPVFKFEVQHCGGVVVCGVGGFLLVLPGRGVFGVGCWSW